MRLFRTDAGVFLEADGLFYGLGAVDWDDLLRTEELGARLEEAIGGVEPRMDLPAARLLKPVGRQEVWAAGVTYWRSRGARMEESEKGGGGSFYDRVYTAERPELFFKATGHRVAGPGEALKLRRDSGWNVPEPELTLLVSPGGRINGYTIGNDMSSRDIEGENPLYLPQAKVWDTSCAMGPGILVTAISRLCGRVWWSFPGRWS